MSVTLPRFLDTLRQQAMAAEAGRMILVRNYEGLPATNVGRDIDLVTTKTALTSWETALKKTAERHSLSLRREFSTYYVSKFVTFDRDRGFRLEIDLNFALVWRGVRFADIHSAELTEYAPGIFVPADPGLRTFITFCHSFLYGGFINQKYLREFREAARTSDSFRHHLSRVFSPKDAKLLLSRLSNGSWEMRRWAANAIRIRTIIRSGGSEPASTALGFLNALMPPSRRRLVLC